MEGASHWAALALIVAVVALVALVEVGRWVLLRWWRRARAIGRARRAKAGERNAEALLERAGWRVVDRQPTRTLRLEVDGEPREVHLRADLLVRRRWELMIAEVKTGTRAPAISTRATRRQLLEYRVAWSEVDGVLLVDPEAGRIREVVFPIEARSSTSRSLLVGAVLVAVVEGFVLWGILGS